jgi:hypothetical protein
MSGRAAPAETSAKSESAAIVCRVLADVSGSCADGYLPLRSEMVTTGHVSTGECCWNFCWKAFADESVNLFIAVIWSVHRHCYP